MKKYIAILAVFLIGMIGTVAAQDRTVTLTGQDTYHSFTLDASDTISNNGTTWWALTKMYGNYPTTQDWSITLDSIADASLNGSVTVQPQGRKFSDGTWTNIGSAVTWYMTTGDTTIVISNATAARYREFKLLTTQVGTAKSQITKLEEKIWWE